MSTNSVHILIFALFLSERFQLFSSEELCSFSKSKFKCMCRYQAQPNKPFPVHSADCTRMSLTEFPRDTHLPSIEDLDLSQNLISILDHDYNNFESVLLRFLNLSFNKIVYLFQDFFINTPSLSVLDLSHNEIVYLSNANVFRGLGNLTVLNLSFNKLSTLPEDVFRPLKNLKELDLRFNYLGATLMQHSSFFKLSMGFPRNISKLNLDGIGIAKLPNGYFDEGRQLKYLSLSDNPLTEIPLVSSIVEHLDLSGTHITIVSGKHLPYKSLKVLKLNRLKRLEEIEHYAFFNLKSLEELHLSNSKSLRSLPDLAFGILSNNTEVTLKRMHIARTGIKTLNSTYLHLFKKVKLVDLQHNPWDCNCEILWLQQLNVSLNRYDNIRMQQQQLAAQLANHGGSRPPQLSSPTHSSDSDSDISLGTHSPPLSSPNPLRYASPTPISTFRFGPHSPGPMPTQFRFGNHSPPSFRLDGQSPPNSNLRKLGSSNSPVNIDSHPASYRLDRNISNNLRLAVSESPINVDATDFRSNKTSPIRVDLDVSPPQTSLQHSPPINLRVNPSDSLSLHMHPETPLPLRLGATAPLRIQVSLPSKMPISQNPQTNLHIGDTTHGIGGIVRIAPPNPANPPPLHRPFSPPRLT